MCWVNTWWCRQWMCLLFLQDEIDHSHSMTYQVFPTLSDWISMFLKTNGDMTASNIGNNMLVEQVHLVLSSQTGHKVVLHSVVFDGPQWPLILYHCVPLSVMWTVFHAVVKYLLQRLLSSFGKRETEYKGYLSEYLATYLIDVIAVS